MEGRGPRVPRSKSPKVQGFQGPGVPGSQGPGYLKLTFKYELDSKEGPSCCNSIFMEMLTTAHIEAFYLLIIKFLLILNKLFEIGSLSMSSKIAKKNVNINLKDQQSKNFRSINVIE